jgi:EmrB/QacA subfamily drug resistance transporter
MFALLAGPLLSMIDSNVVNVAVPHIADDLGTTLTSVQWTVSGYLLALAATLPATSYLAKRHGTVRVYAISLAAFTLTSVACAFAATIGQLIAFRTAQGVAAAPLVPLAMTMLFGSAGAGDRDFPVAAGLALFLGPALGPTVGGLLLTAGGWPAIFLVNAPIGVAAFLVLPRFAAAGIVDAPDRVARFDPFGLLLLSAGLSAALYGTSQGPSHGWFSARAAPWWIGGALAVAGYVAWARRREHPAVDLRLLRGRSALAVTLCTLTSVAMFGVLFLVPIAVQDIGGHGPLAAGLMLLPQGVVMGLSTKFGAMLGPRGWQRAGIVAGLAALAVTTASLVLVDADTPLWVIAALMSGRGLGIGLVIQPLITASLAGLDRGALADANTLFNVGQRLGGSVGVSLLATYFTLRVTARVGAVLTSAGVPASAASSGVGHLSQTPEPLRTALRAAAFGAFHDTIWVAAGIALLGVVGAAFLPRPSRARSLSVEPRHGDAVTEPATP